KNPPTPYCSRRSMSITVHRINKPTPTPRRSGDKSMATLQIPELDQAWFVRDTQIPSSSFDGSAGPRIIGPKDGKFVNLQSVGVRFMVWGAETGGTFSLVEHPIPPRTLVAPLHLHEREDEYSYVLEGRMGAQLGDDVVFAEPGDL